MTVTAVLQEFISRQQTFSILFMRNLKICSKPPNFQHWGQDVRHHKCFSHELVIYSIPPSVFDFFVLECFYIFYAFNAGVRAEIIVLKQMIVFRHILLLFEESFHEGIYANFCGSMQSNYWGGGIYLRHCIPGFRRSRVSQVWSQRQKYFF